MADQESNPILTKAEPQHELTFCTLGSQTVTLKCDNEPAILAPAQEIRRLRRENSINIFEHVEEGEKQGNHLGHVVKWHVRVS